MRSISLSGLATIASTALPPTILLLLVETATVIRLNSSPVTVAYQGTDYLGAGNFGSVEEVNDTPGDESAMRFTLSGVPADSLALALRDAPDTKGARATLSLALLDPSSKTIVDVLQLFTGFVDQMPINFSPESSSIAAVCTHRGETFSRPKPLRNTDADQQRLYPGDTSRRFVVSQAQKQDVWPSAAFFRQ